MVFKRKLHCQRVWWEQCRQTNILYQSHRQGLLYYQPKQFTVPTQIPSNCHTFAAGFIPTKCVPFIMTPSWVRHGIYLEMLQRTPATNTQDSGTRCPTYKHGKVSSLAEGPKSIATSRWASGWRHWQRRWAPRRWEQPWNSIPDSEKSGKYTPKSNERRGKERHLQTTNFLGSKCEMEEILRWGNWMVWQFDQKQQVCVNLLRFH